jgi:hypothetical protein
MNTQHGRDNNVYIIQTNQPTNSMKQSPWWEADSYLAGQEIIHFCGT